MVKLTVLASEEYLKHQKHKFKTRKHQTPCAALFLPLRRLSHFIRPHSRQIPGGTGCLQKRIPCLFVQPSAITCLSAFPSEMAQTYESAAVSP